MSGRADASVALPILLCGILGGLVGGLNCCCWLAPGATGLLCVRWARNVRGDDSPVLGIGLLASLISALLVATWGTALFLYLNDPSRMGESQAVVEELLGTGGDELPMGMMALGVAGMGFVFTLAVGLVGAAIGSIGAGRRAPARGAPPSQSMSATRFLDPHRPTTQASPSPAAPPVIEQAPTPSPQVAAGPPEAVVMTPLPLPIAPPAVVPAPPAIPEPAPSERPVEPAPDDWSRFQRPSTQTAPQPDIDVRSDELANSDGERSAWEDEGE